MDSMTIEWIAPSADRVRAHLTDPANLAWLAYTVLAAVVAGSASKLRASESLAAGWFLWNGAIIHLAMDGLVGGYHNWPLMDKSYRILDRRANDDVPESQGGPPYGQAMITWTIFNCELFIHSSLCFISYVGIVRRAPWRQPFEIMALTWQLVGAVLFIVPELLAGCANLVPQGKEYCIPGFSIFELFYWCVFVRCARVLSRAAIPLPTAARRHTHEASRKRKRPEQTTGGSRLGQTLFGSSCPSLCSSRRCSPTRRKR